MNLSKLFETQKALDERIYDRFPELRGKDNLDWKILALQVELGECANEWRGFKKWSENREPRTRRKEFDWKNNQFHVYNPLLEEYVDVLHFILSIGNDILVKVKEPIKLISLSNNITGQFNSLFGLISRWDTATLLIDQERFYLVMNNFLHLGEMLGFTWEQIEAAYYAKNQINHDRQATGY